MCKNLCDVAIKVRKLWKSHISILHQSIGPFLLYCWLVIWEAVNCSNVYICSAFLHCANAIWSDINCVIIHTTTREQQIYCSFAFQICWTVFLKVNMGLFWDQIRLTNWQHTRYVEHFGRFQLKPKLTKLALKQIISQDFLFNAILKNFPSSAFPVEGKIGSLEFFSKLEIQQAEVGNE